MLNGAEVDLQLLKLTSHQCLPRCWVLDTVTTLLLLNQHPPVVAEREVLRVCSCDNQFEEVPKSLVLGDKQDSLGLGR